MPQLDDRLLEADSRLRESLRGFNVLAAIAWPSSVLDEFLARWRAGDPVLPKPPAVAVASSETDQELESAQALLDTGHPLGEYLHRTAASYRLAIAMVDNAETPRFSELSSELYGKPRLEVFPGGPTGHDVADHFIVESRLLADGCPGEEAGEALSSEEFADALRAEADALFEDDPVAIVVDPDIAAKALASRRRVRIRGGVLFNPNEVQQLLHHELLVHVATAQNGYAHQPLPSFGLSAPRTTETQEGLATVAELVKGVMDLTRLRRIALRVEAIDMALEGADFIDVFEFFLSHGQSEVEACRSAARVFRGGDVKGRVAFTKDTVYMRGLVRVHTFLRRIIASRELHLIPILFAGRLTLGDALRLAPLFEDGTLNPPRYVPPWALDTQALAAWLAFLRFAVDLPAGDLELSDFD